MLEKYFIHAKKKKDFLNELNAGNILEEAVVFIENTKEIYHKGVYYNCKSIDISGCVTESQVQNIVLQAFDELSTVAFSGSYYDLTDKPSRVWYGTSTTPKSVDTKIVNCYGYTLASGERIAVKFADANTASNPKLNVNNNGAKPIYGNGSALPSSQYWPDGAVIEFLYDGSYYHMLGAVKDTDTTITVDTELSDTSENAVQNKVVTAAINGIDTRVQEIEDFFDEGVKLNLTIKSNQGTDSTISAVKATIEYDGQSVQVGSGVIGLPVFTDTKITFPDVEGYKTPAPLEFTTGAIPVVYEVTYETELVNVTVAAWDGASVIDQIITINGTQYTWNGTAIQHKVPFGTEYEVSGNSKDGYMEPEETFTASLATRNVTAIYSAMVGSWITLNQTITDPATMISGDVNGEHIQLIRNNSHRYLGKYTADGTMTVCQLDDTDSNLYADGSVATLTGTEGDVFMKLPKFYYVAKEKQTDVGSIGFYYGESAPSSAWKEWDGNDLIGAYFARIENDKLYSSSVDVSPGSHNTLKAAAIARGNGFSLLKWKHHCMMAFLFYAMYGNTNSPAIIGDGSGGSFFGSNAFGMEDSTADRTDIALNFWGLEFWWGKNSQWLDNVIVNPETANNIWRITEDNGSIRDVQGIRIQGYASKLVIGEYLDLIPSSATLASETTGYCANFWISKSTALVVSKGFSTKYLIGLNVDKTASAGSGLSRLAFRGNIIINNDSTAFKALTAIG